MSGINSLKQKGKKDRSAETSESAGTGLLNDNRSGDSPARLAFLWDITAIKHCHTKVLKMNEDESILQKQTGCSVRFNPFMKEISDTLPSRYSFASR